MLTIILSIINSVQAFNADINSFAHAFNVYVQSIQLKQHLLKTRIVNVGGIHARAGVHYVFSLLKSAVRISVTFH